MNLHRGLHFEREVWTHLPSHGWHSADGYAAHDDHACAVVLPDLLA